MKKTIFAWMVGIGLSCMPVAIAVENDVPIFPPSEEEQKAQLEREKQECQQAKERGEEKISERCKELIPGEMAGRAAEEDWKVNTRADL